MRLRLDDPPLDPTGDQARAELRRELLGPDYHRQDLIQQIQDWLLRHLDAVSGSARDASPWATTAAMVVLALLVVGLALLLSRLRRSARARQEKRSVLTPEVVSAAELRRRADLALAQDRLEDAVVEGFRALTVRQVERARLDDTPGATAHEVAAVLGGEHPPYARRIQGCADLFDAVLYGHRSATRAQAQQVLGLDDELAGVRA